MGQDDRLAVLFNYVCYLVHSHAATAPLVCPWNMCH